MKFLDKLFNRPRRVVIKCRYTNRVVFTGLVITSGSFRNSILEENIFDCPACGNEHIWDQKDAWLE